MKKLLALLSGLLISVGVQAKDPTPLNVIRIGATGGASEMYTLHLSKYLDERGWKTNLFAAKDCKEAERWVQKNPKEPVIYITYLDDFILPKIAPDHPSACPGLTMTKESLVTVIYRAYMTICSRGDKGPEDFLKGSPAKVGLWAHPTNVRSFNDLMKDLKLDHRAVAFAKGPDVKKSLVSKDVDFVAISVELPYKDSGYCFITTAPKDLAAKMSDFKTGGPRISTEDLSNQFTRRGAGLIPIYIAYNVDMNRLRKDVVDILNTAPEYAVTWKLPGTFRSGVMAGKTPEQQWDEVEQLLKSY